MNETRSGCVNFGLILITIFVILLMFSLWQASNGQQPILATIMDALTPALITVTGQ